MLILCILTFFFPLSAVSNNHENLKMLRERIQTLQKDLTSNETLKQDTTDALQETERAISNITHRLNKLIENDRQANEEYKQLQIQHSQIRNKIGTERNHLEKMLYQQYVGGQQDFLRLVLNQQDPNQIARDIYYYQQLSLTRSKTIKNLRNDQDEIETLTQISRQKKEEITAIQAEYFDQRKKLAQEKTKHQTILAQLSSQITQQKQEINKLENDEKQIKNLDN